jgi:hypothetical protein
MSSFDSNYIYLRLFERAKDLILRDFESAVLAKSSAQ